ncbi:MAG: type II toxin-antitoxin system RelE/ParE family toxin [Thermodesulfobacteriota bacterium]|nr:MAG: type II toxin-antitoxin system RelE/ParE family toxin [Thermodesulfobacteriota bacterium]
MRGGGYADVLPVLQVPDNKADAVPCERLRFIQNGLCELRVKSKEGIARVFFCTKIGKRIIMLYIFIKKSQKTPKRELKIAFERLKEVIKNET